MKKIKLFLIPLLFCISIVTKGQDPVITMTTAKCIGETISFSLTLLSRTNIYVDFGDGTKVSFSFSESSVSGTIVGSQTIKIYGAGIFILNCPSNQLTSIDISKYTSLYGLYCDDNQLTTIDITKNLFLHHLGCSSNQITTLDVSKNSMLEFFNCSSNRLTELDVSKNYSLVTLNCSSNQLTSLDITKNLGLYSVNCSSNQLITLLAGTGNWEYTLYCPNNQLNLKSLPSYGILSPYPHVYIYAPQKPMLIVKDIPVGVELDLNSQYLSYGKITNYIWKSKSGSTLTQGIDYTISNGKTIFQYPQEDSVYCEMTNDTFPEFTGNDVLKTTYTKVSLATAIGKIKKQEVRIYTYRQILNSNLQQNAEILIFDISGRLIKSKFLKSGMNAIPMTNAGIYLVKIIGNKESITQKVIIE